MGYLKNRLRSIGIAMRGVFLLVRTEASIQVQLIIALCVTVAGFYFDISPTEWMLQLLAIGAVMGVEGMNTAVEKLADYVQPERDVKIGFLKDVSAGAVMLVAIMAIIVGLVIYLSKIFIE